MFNKFYNKNKKTPKNFEKIVKICCLLFLTIVSVFILVGTFEKSKHQEMFEMAGRDIVSLGLVNCKFMSPIWMPINYYTSGNVMYLPYNITTAIANNIGVVIFYDFPTADDNYEKSELETIKPAVKNEYYMIFTSENMTNETCVQWGV